MNIAVITNDDLKQELLSQGLQDNITVQYTEELPAVGDADCYIDLLFEPTEDRINKLQELQPALIIVNSVVAASTGLPANFIRINGWTTFLKRPIVEASSDNDESDSYRMKNKTENIFSYFGKKIEWVPGIDGFVTARVISMIINEAYFALDEKVSSKAEIDTAMKLGTNYPFGPFEWSQKIGLKNIYQLLESLSKNNSRYQPSDLLKQEAIQL
jgi:3-hydroxybutyryl-CoA dehydrogenase